MRHHNANRKFGRSSNQRRALLRSLAGNLIVTGKIVTTEAKAKELRPYIEKLVSKGKEGTVAAKRLITSRLGVASRAKKLVNEIAPKYSDRKGGYTRVVKMPKRKSDGSKMAVVEFV